MKLAIKLAAILLMALPCAAQLNLGNGSSMQVGANVSVTGCGVSAPCTTTQGGTGANTPAAGLANLGGLPLSGGTLTGALTGTSASFSGTVTAGATVVGKVIQLPGGVQSAGTFASYLLTYGANTTYVLPPSYSETVTSTIALSQNNVNIQCGAGATLLNGTTGTPSPVITITGTNDTIGSGCTVDNQLVQITSSYDYGAITLISSTNTVLNGVIAKHCGTAYGSSPCITAENINGAQFDQMNLDGNLAIWAWNTQGSINWEVIGGTMNTLAAAVNGVGSTIKNYRISGTNLNAIGGDAVCGAIGVYSGVGEIGYIQNGTVTGTTCTISGTASVAVNNVAISGSGSTGTITLTLASATPFWLAENVTMSTFVTNTCLNGKDLQVTATSGSNVSFSTNGTTCATASGADTGIAKAAAFAGWSNPSYGQRGFTFSNNTVQFAYGTNQYVNDSGYEMGCTECTIKNNVFVMPDAYAQNYACIISYSDDAIIEGNLCNGFGALAGGIGVAGGVGYPSLPNNDNVQILNNTIINTAATSIRGSVGIDYGCNYPGGHIKSGQVSGNKIVGSFYRGMDIQDSSSGYACPVEGVVHGNQIYGAATGINVNHATASITDTLYSGVTTQSVLANFTPETSTSNTPEALASGSTGVTQTASDTSTDLATDAFVANWIPGQTNVLPFPYGIANGPQTAPPYNPVAWYPAASTCSTTGTTPTTLIDSSGNGYALTGTGATCEMSIVNGNPVLRFAGTGTGYKAAFGVSLTTGTTLVSIYRKTVGVAYAFMVDGYASGVSNSIFYNPTATTLKAEANSVPITATVADDNNVHVAIYTLTSTGTGTLYLDGTQVATGAQGSSEFLNGLTIGARGGDGLVPWNGDIAETVVYGSAFTLPQVQSFGQYASTKYGLVQAGTWSIVNGVARFASEYVGGNLVAGTVAAGTSMTGPNMPTISAPAVIQNAIFMGDSRFCTQGYSNVCAWGTVPYPIDSPGSQIHTDYVNDLMQTPLFAGRYQTVKNYGIAGQAVCNYNYASFGHPYSPAVTGYTGSYFELEGGINDLNSGATDATVEGCLSSIYSSAKTDGYTQTVAHTIYGSTSCNASTTCLTFLYNVNEWIKNQQGVLFSRVIDDAGILGETSAYPTSPDWYDGTHLSATGYQKLATNAAATLALPVNSMKAPYTPTPAGSSVAFLGYPYTQITTGNAGTSITLRSPQQTVVGSGGTATVTAYSVVIASQTQGVGYSGTGTCAVNGGTYTVQATCSATLNSTGGLTFAITAGGTYTTLPTSITFSGFGYTAGTAATATPALSIQAVTVTAGGSGYTSDLTAIFPNCTGAIPATVTQSSGVIQTVTATGGICTLTTNVLFVASSLPAASTYIFTPAIMQFLPQAPNSQGSAATTTQNWLGRGVEWDSTIYKSGSVGGAYTCVPYYGGGSNTLGMNCTISGTGLYYGPWAAPLFFGRYGTGESANLTASGTITIDQSVSTKSLYIYTLAGNTTFAVTNPYNGESLTFVIKQGAGFNVTWPANFYNAPPISSTQNSVSGTYVVASCIYSATQFLWYCNSSASNTPPIRAGTWSISAATSAAVTFTTAMSVVPTSCSVTPSASSATTGQPFPTSLLTTGFTVNVPVSGTIAGTYSCTINNGN